MNKELDIKTILAIYKLGGEKVPCFWNNSFSWSDFCEVKNFNKDYFMLRRRCDSEGAFEYYIYSKKKNMLVDGFTAGYCINLIFDHIKIFERENP